MIKNYCRWHGPLCEHANEFGYCKYTCCCNNDVIKERCYENYKSSSEIHSRNADIDVKEGFIITDMIKVYEAEVENKIIDNMLNISRKYHMEVDEQKLKKWMAMCIQFENIDHDKRLKLAFKKKINEKDHKIKVLEKALELACEECFVGEIRDGKTNIIIVEKQELYDYFIAQAEKEVKDVKD